nr:hypothetical protein GCM10020063_061060 [Dactylosporangium thailandense]
MSWRNTGIGVAGSPCGNLDGYGPTVLPGQGPQRAAKEGITGICGALKGARRRQATGPFGAK